MKTFSITIDAESEMAVKAALHEALRAIEMESQSFLSGDIPNLGYVVSVQGEGEYKI